ncbi:hypothetical protein ACWCXH_06075 [Kitasatospora sp. NPDC001660]
MAAERGEESERDPVQAFIDEAFEEMMRESRIPPKTATKYGKDPLAWALVEAAAASMSQPSSAQMSELERVLFAQTLATALAEALVPALADTLSVEIMKVLNRRATAEAGNKDLADSSHGARGSDERKEAHRS